MMNVFRRPGTFGALLLAILSTTLLMSRQMLAQEPVTALKKQLDRLDLAVSAAGEFSSNSSGTTYLPQVVSLKPSTTVGVLVQLRYTKSPLIGAEFNYGNTRFTEDFTIANTTGSPASASQFALGIQSAVSEYTVGYVAHTPRYFGVQPFAGVGGGALAFRPTRNGGQGVLSQARGAFYYTVGVENIVYGEHFGLRASFRQLFYAAPDFQANYLANGQRAITSEPTIGFFLRY